MIRQEQRTQRCFWVKAGGCYYNQPAYLMGWSDRPHFSNIHPWRDSLQVGFSRRLAPKSTHVESSRIKPTDWVWFGSNKWTNVLQSHYGGYDWGRVITNTLPRNVIIGSKLKETNPYALQTRWKDSWNSICVKFSVDVVLACSLKKMDSRSSAMAKDKNQINGTKRYPTPAYYFLGHF